MKRTLEGFILLAALMVLSLFYTTSALATANFARKYNVPCSRCHRPNIPRLNPEGHRFRKMGYRFPNDLGALPTYKEIGDYAAARIRERYRYEDRDDQGNLSQFETDASLYYAGPITPNLSIFAEAEWQDTNDIELNAYGTWTQGTQDDYYTIKFGQFYPLYKEGWGGFDRPSGIRDPRVFSTQLTTTSNPFTFTEKQKGVELDMGISRDSRIVAEVLNGLNYNGRGSSGNADDDRSKDVLLAYETILDEDGSGFTIFGYRGIWHQNPLGTNNGTVVGSNNKFRYYRYGATLSYLAGIIPSGLSELQLGAIFSYDDVPSNYPGISSDEHGQAYYIGLEQYLGDASAFARVEFIELDTGDDDWETTYTLGTSYMVNEYLRLAGEVYYINHRRVAGNTGIGNSIDEPGLALEAQLNF